MACGHDTPAVRDGRISPTLAAISAIGRDSHQGGPQSGIVSESAGAYELEGSIGRHHGAGQPDNGEQRPLATDVGQDFLFASFHDNMARKTAAGPLA